MTQTTDTATTIATTAADSPLPSRGRGAGGERSFPRYPAYRESGVPWLGAIPAHWTLSKLGAGCRVKARLGWKGLKADEYVDQGYIFLSTPNIKDTEIDFADVNYITAERYFESPEIMIEVGDVLIAKDGSTLGITNVVRHLPAPATVNSSIALIRQTGGIDSIFLCWFFRSHFVQNVIQQMKDGMGVPHLFQADLRKFVVLLPPLAEQRAIAAFLDRETARIDALVAAKRRLIELLREKRAALISRAVTRGLDATDLVQHAGTGEFFGTSWQLLPLKRRVAIKITDGPHETPAFVDEGVPFISAEAIQGSEIDFDAARYITTEAHAEYSRKAEPRYGDILLCKAGATTGKLAMVRVDFPFSIWSPLALIRAYPPRMNPEFLFYALHAPYVQEQIKQTSAINTQPNIGMAVIERLVIGAPSIVEQRAIAAYLDAETAKLDALAGRIEEQIARLREYRTALIAAAVTGAIDVRHLQPSDSRDGSRA